MHNLLHGTVKKLVISLHTIPSYVSFMIDKKQQLNLYRNVANLFVFVMEMQCELWKQKWTIKYCLS
jgi:hypothetical protein